MGTGEYKTYFEGKNESKKPMTNTEKEQVKELCDRVILSFMNIDKVVETLENNEWAEFTLAEGDFMVQLRFYNRGFEKND